MPELLVMRHAKSAWDTGDPDHLRPLAPRGERDRVTMARWLVANDLRPDRVICSTAVRARETAQYVIDTFGLDPADTEFDDQLYHAGFRQWLGRIRDQTVPRVLARRKTAGRPPVTSSGAAANLIRRRPAPTRRGSETVSSAVSLGILAKL